MELVAGSLLVVGALVSVAAGAPDSRKGLKLSGPMQPSPQGDVIELRIAPGGARVVFTGTGGSGGALELYSVPIDRNSPPIQLSAPRVAGGTLLGFRVSPDGTRVVYWADQVLDEAVELFMVPTDGSLAPVRLHPAFTPHGDFALPVVAPALEISADSSRVVYLADTHPAQGEVFELFSVPLDGSAAPVRLNGPLVAGGDVGETAFSGFEYLEARGFELSPDSSRVVYLADQAVDGRREIYSVAIDGSGPRLKLNRPLLTGEYVGDRNGRGHTLAIAPDSSRAAFLFVRNSGQVELHSAPLDASLPSVVLNHSLPQTFSRVYTSFAFTEDSSRVVYLADQNDYPIFEVLYEVWSVPSDRSAPPVQLSQALPFGQGVHPSIAIGADRVAYQAVDQVFSVPLDGSAAPVALASGVPSIDGAGAGLRLTSDGSRVLYRFGDLFSVPIDASAAAIPLSALQRGTVRDFDLSSDGTVAVYRADDETEEEIHLLAVPVDGSQAPWKLNPPLVPGGDVQSVSATDHWPEFEIAPDGSRVVYVADQAVPDVAELFAVPIDGAQPPLRLNDPLGAQVVGGDVTAFQFTPDGTRVVYVADQDVDGVQALYSRRVSLRPDDPSAPPVRLSSAFEIASDQQFRLTADGARAVYRSHRGDAAGNFTDLKSVLVDGSAPPVFLCEPGRSGQRVGQFELSPDGSRVVYSLNSLTETALWSVPSDGSAPPCRIGRQELLGTTPGGDVAAPGDAWLFGFAISPRGNRVVYSAFPDGRIELFSAPITGGIPTKISGPMVPGGSVSRFRFSPDGARVLFTADAVTDGVLELFAVPPRGTAAPLRLNGPLVPGGLVWFDHFRVSPDGAHVVYAAKEDSLVLELYSVPLDGGAPPIRISGTLAPGQQVDTLGEFTIAADSQRVVYRVLLHETDAQLYSAPLAGDSPPVRLNGPLVQFGGVGSFYDSGFRISLDASRVVYFADQHTDGVAELFSVPIDGSQPEVRLGGPIPGEFAIGPDDQRAVFRATQGTGAIELFAARTEGGPAAKLNAALASGGNVAYSSLAVGPTFRIDPRGLAVAYVADQDTDQVTELYLSVLPPHHR